jgi:hypothetical protein
MWLKQIKKFYIRYKEFSFKVKLKKTVPKSRFAKHVLNYNYYVKIDINTDLEILNTQNYVVSKA